MGREQLMWASLRDNIGHRWHAQRHEDALAVGIPDVSYGANKVQGWIELKCLDSWPKRPDTIVRIEHYTPDQKAWLWLRGNAGGRCWLLLKVERTWLLFSHVQARQVGLLKQTDLRALATKVWESRLDGEEFLETIT